MNDPNPSGKCLCGCGQKTSVITATNRPRGHIAGHHRLFVIGHNANGGPALTHEAIMSRFVVSEHGCWEWSGFVDRAGYGVINSNLTQGKQFAHRYFYEALVGPIPDGLTIDHLCFNPRCVNPAHLQAVTLSENVKRSHARRRLAGSALEAS